jgi:glucose-6-phosphate isomerase
MLTKNINFKNFKLKKSNIKIKKDLDIVLRENNEILKSLKKGYKNNYNKKTISKFKKYSHFSIIGMGGSILGAESIYDFLKHKIKKNFYFNSNLRAKIKHFKKKNQANLIISKSGNTLETIVNSNIIIKKNDENIFIIENRESYLYLLARKLKAEIVHHNNFIGGRYSVLSEVGMLPAELMGLSISKFKQLNNLIKNKKFINALIINVSNTLFFLKQKKFNSIILNYDESSDKLFHWYQQLVAESLGKKGKGIMPIVSSMPKDNHSVMQLYLDGPKNNFFTFFHVKERKSDQINSSKILSSSSYLRNKDLSKVILSQKLATEKVFLNKNIPFRSFDIINRNETTIGELFCFFILETILLGRALNVNPYDQPSVELIKKETKEILI